MPTDPTPTITRVLAEDLLIGDQAITAAMTVHVATICRISTHQVEVGYTTPDDTDGHVTRVVLHRNQRVTVITPRPDSDAGVDRFDNELAVA